jgi:hypothetical protein
MARVNACSAYSRRENAREFYHCRTCGCLTHYESPKKGTDGRVAVNARMMDQLAVAESRLRSTRRSHAIVADIGTGQNRLDFSNSRWRDMLNECETHRDRIHPLPPPSRLGRRRTPAGAHASGIPTRSEHRPDRHRVAARDLSPHTAHPRHRTRAHLEDNLAAAALHLDQDEIHAITAAVSQP